MPNTVIDTEENEMPVLRVYSVTVHTSSIHVQTSVMALSTADAVTTAMGTFFDDDQPFEGLLISAHPVIAPSTVH